VSGHHRPAIIRRKDECYSRALHTLRPRYDVKISFFVPYDKPASLASVQSSRVVLIKAFESFLSSLNFQEFMDAFKEVPFNLIITMGRSISSG
jgi:hypothetical protein